jgi:methylated-DNA-[protein]-cysteine S-methyltransferase
MRGMRYAWYDSPIGRLLLAGGPAGLERIVFPREGGPAGPAPGWEEDAPAFARVVQELEEYFAGRRERFELPLAFGGTGFQREVWKALLAIPYGETVSYTQLAERIGRPRAVRAVGAANGANPIPIIVPCHRVIGRDGSLTGFGGGLPLKRRLLELESRQKTLFAAATRTT